MPPPNSASSRSARGCGQSAARCRSGLRRHSDRGRGAPPTRGREAVRSSGIRRARLPAGGGSCRMFPQSGHSSCIAAWWAHPGHTPAATTADNKGTPSVPTGRRIPQSSAVWSDLLRSYRGRAFERAGVPEMRNIGVGERGRHDRDPPAAGSCGVRKGGAPARGVGEPGSRTGFSQARRGGCLFRGEERKKGGRA